MRQSSEGRRRRKPRHQNGSVGCLFNDDVNIFVCIESSVSMKVRDELEGILEGSGRGPIEVV
jgi:hypothetical protein